MAEQVFNELKKEMLLLTGSSVDELLNIWSRRFDQPTCSNNLRKLVELTNNFFNDLLSESLQKESFLKNEIEKLRSEAEDLQRLLQTEVKLPNGINDGTVPLSVVLSELNESLRNPRDELDHRIEQICELLFEQDTICDELGEPTRALIDDPLPTIEEVAAFRAYLNDLERERVKRKQELLSLRKEIQQYLQILEPEGSTDADDRLLNDGNIKLNNETFESLNRMRDNLKEQVDKLEKKKREDKAPQSNGAISSHMCCSSGVPESKTPSSTKSSTAKRLSFGSDAQKQKLNSKAKTTPLAKQCARTGPRGVSVKPEGCGKSGVFSTPNNMRLPADLSASYATTSSADEFLPTAEKKFKFM